jgi:hypothetical protein
MEVAGIPRWQCLRELCGLSPRAYYTDVRPQLVGEVNANFY